MVESAALHIHQNICPDYLSLNVECCTFLNLNDFFCSGRSDGAGVEGRHCESHDYKAAAVLVENGPHHCGSDEQGQCLYTLVFMLV